jgi:2,3,4,5-tetrahydropyridine-2,6-dicarboxylate N-succinyltransferase
VTTAPGLDPVEPSGSASEGSRPLDDSASALEVQVMALDAAWRAAEAAEPQLVEEARAVVADLVAALENGQVRSATPDPAVADGWRIHAWVKTGILLGFRLPGMTEYRDGPIIAARDKSAFGVLDLLESESSRAASAAGAPWRVVPGGSAVRSGVHLEPGVTIMPPAYANVGAWVGRGTMIDSHALVGSCAQVGQDVHLSAAAQIGGVLEPAGARPVIVEDGAFIGGGAGLYEGVIVSRGAVIAAGTVITGQSRLLDLVAEQELRGTPASPLVVPANAVVVPGTRPATSAWARERGISVTLPLIVKYRDAGTDARVALEETLR